MRKCVKFISARPVLIAALIGLGLISCGEPSSSQQKKQATTPIVVAGPPPEGTPIDWSVFAPIGNPDAIYAGDVTPMLAEVGADFCRVFTNGAERIIGNAPPNPPPALGGRRIIIKVQGRECQSFFFTHAPSRIVYKVPEGVKRFTAIGTMPEEIHESEGTWSYIVKINDQKVFETPWLVHAKQKYWLIDVPIPSHAKTIQLIVHEGNNKFCDNAVWAWPYFHK
ncbi:MAG: NPCBM/NEW2 domain-containing protein [Methylacidiphilales bacterium]|nr:NPCBM/NEW2 domain-containing protein [Candidatus Methylacidiphilales bacterium]MDW8348717.1 NPCBM/NEW2 domain-containing protein [Verrucomicrobiae bacterium]